MDSDVISIYGEEYSRASLERQLEGLRKAEWQNANWEHSQRQVASCEEDMKHILDTYRPTDYLGLKLLAEYQEQYRTILFLRGRYDSGERTEELYFAIGKLCL